MNKHNRTSLFVIRFRSLLFGMVLIFSLVFTQLGISPVGVAFADPSYDYGDAPAPYPVLESGAGAKHEAAGPTLGSNRDSELDGLSSSNADGDDTDGVPDWCSTNSPNALLGTLTPRKTTKPAASQPGTPPSRTEMSV